jgi:hypothetical protein
VVGTLHQGSQDVLETGLPNCDGRDVRETGWAINSVPAGSHINLYPETPEVYEAVKISNEILTQGWDTQMYCTVPQWVQLIQTMCTSGSAVTVQEIDESKECSYKGTRSLAIREDQEAMDAGVSFRERGYSDSTA